MSDARVEAGRRNGLLAKGKKSPEGRQISAQNSMKHGLFAKSLILANESHDLYEDLRKAYYDNWRPENDLETYIVDAMAAAHWRTHRALTIETETIDLRQARMANSGELDKEFDVVPEPVRLAIAYAKEVNDSATLRSISRAESHLHRLISRKSKELRELRHDRKNAILQNEGNAEQDSTS